MQGFSVYEALVFFLILLASLSVHEWAHAWTAEKLGDSTARMMGRVTFNPIPHIDPVGTIIVPAFFLSLFRRGCFFRLGEAGSGQSPEFREAQAG